MTVAGYQGEAMDFKCGRMRRGRVKMKQVGVYGEAQWDLFERELGYK